MTTIQINKRTKAGKILLELAQMLSEGQKGVKIIDSKKMEEEYPVSKNVPNEETLRSMERTSKGIGLTECKDVDDLFKKLDL